MALRGGDPSHRPFTGLMEEWSDGLVGDPSVLAWRRGPEATSQTLHVNHLKSQQPRRAWEVCGRVHLRGSLVSEGQRGQAAERRGPGGRTSTAQVLAKHPLSWELQDQRPLTFTWSLGLADPETPSPACLSFQAGWTVLQGLRRWGCRL